MFFCFLFPRYSGIYNYIVWMYRVQRTHRKSFGSLTVTWSSTSAYTCLADKLSLKKGHCKIWNVDTSHTFHRIWTISSILRGAPNFTVINSMFNQIWNMVTISPSVPKLGFFEWWPDMFLFPILFYYDGILKWPLTFWI